MSNATKAPTENYSRAWLLLKKLDLYRVAVHDLKRGQSCNSAGFRHKWLKMLRDDDNARGVAGYGQQAAKAAVCTRNSRQPEQVSRFRPGSSTRRRTLRTTLTSAITTRELHNADEEPKNPPHQSDLIRTEGIEELGLSSVSKAAKLLKVRRATLSEPLHGKSAVTPEMALRIEKAIGPDMNHLLSMQLAYDVARMRGDAKRINVKRAFRREKAGVYRLYQLAL